MIYQQSIHTPLGIFLQPPNNYELEHLLATTYSLDAQAFVSLAIYGFLAAQGDELDNVQLKEIVFQENEIRDWAKEHFTVFTHFLPTHVDNNIIWEQCSALSDLCCIKIQNQGTFHPKLLLACFKNTETNDRFFRLQVSSQNLGSVSAVELGICFEGYSSHEHLESQPKHNINGSQLLQFFQTFYSGTLPEHLNSLGNVKFEHKSDPWYKIENISFEFTDKQGKKLICRLKEEFCNERELHVYSPFLTPDENNKLYLENNGFKNVYYYTNLTKLLFDQKDNIKNVFYISSDCGTTPFIHAKLYCQEIETPADCKAAYRIFLGSANASQNGLENNIELMVSFDWIFTKLPDGDLRNKITTEWNWLYALANGAADKNYFFIKLCSETTQEPLDDENDRMHHLLLHYMAQCKATLTKTQQDNKYQVCVSTPATTNGLELKVLELEHLQYSDNMILSQLPCGKLLRAELGMEYQDINGNQQQITAVGTIPLIIQDNELNEIFSQNKPTPTPLLSLLTEYSARDAIPRCRRKGFAHPKDDVMERLEAYTASWQGSPREASAWEGAAENVQRAYDGLINSNDKENWENIFMTDEEKKKLKCLYQILKS
ncbi:MAG: phospholipase D family protein [Oscillospiraceae bacterium]|nr:phospholipase D family protein [Oscillospiraceae bacterium]